MQLPIGFKTFHPVPTINYQLNRWLPEARESELRAAALRMSSPADVPEVMLALAEQAQAEGRWLHAATYYRGADFFLPFSDTGKINAYKKYQENFASAFSHVDFRRSQLTYEQGMLHVVQIQPATTPAGTLLIHGGFDSYMEEFFQWGVHLAGTGYQVVLFEGPGQGAAIRSSNLKMKPEWEQPVAAVLNKLQIDRCALVGFSLGGYLALRAAAFDNRISAVVLVNALLDFLDCFLDKAPPQLAQTIRQGLDCRDRTAINGIVERVCADPAMQWSIHHGMYISGASDYYDFLTWTAALNTEAFSGRIKQPCLVTAGTNDHIVPLPQFFKQLSLLSASESLTARLFSEAEHASAHCQVGNLRLLFDSVETWLSTLQPGSW